MLPNFLRRIFKFEFWPWQIFYFPLYPYLLYLSLKYKNAFAFSAINSSISEDSGLFNASKHGILEKVGAEYKPIEVLLDRSSKKGSEIKKVFNTGINFPLICKPNFGERGKNVEKIQNVSDFNSYLTEIDGPIVVQEFIDLKEEFAIVFFKHPETGEVEITSIGQKEFLKVIGDGTRTVKQLLKNNDRGVLYLKVIEKKYPDLMGILVPQGEVLVVSLLENHCRGTKFIDRNDLLDNDSLLKKINKVVEPLEDFHFGRIDLKTENESSLLHEYGKITVFEINGVHAEPSHIYDSDTSIKKAYKDLYNQWDKIYAYGSVCAKNGTPCLTLKKFISLVYLRY